MPDPDTLRMAARLARMRAHPPRSVDDRDGLERLGAQRALEKLAADLETTADHIEKHGDAPDEMPPHP